MGMIGRILRIGLLVLLLGGTMVPAGIAGDELAGATSAATLPADVLQEGNLPAASAIPAEAGAVYQNSPPKQDPATAGFAPTAPSPLQEETLISDDMSQGAWTYAGGFLYWNNNCALGGDPVVAYLKRRAENGQAVQTLAQPASCDALSNYLGADEEGIYYWNDELDDLEARFTEDPYTVTKLADIAPTVPFLIATTDNWVYYTQPDGIYRASKDYAYIFQTSDAVNIDSLVVDDAYIYWLDDTGLWRSDRSCVTPSCWDDKEQLSSLGGQYLSWHGTDRLVWVNSDATNWYIRYITLGVPGTFDYYWSLKTDTMLIGQAMVHEDTLYWMEQLNPSGEVRLRRKVLPTGPVEDLALGLSTDALYRTLAAGISGVIFADTFGIYRVAYDSAPATRDLSLDYYEVTQVVQNLDNDVILVANRPTVVRVYGSVTGPQANMVEVLLHGYRGGNELPGSPLSPLHGVLSLVEGQPLDRILRFGYWSFQLPDEWTQSGELQLEAVVDPRGLYDNDPNPGNDILVDTFGFFTTPPTCIRWVKVWTHPGIEEIWLNPRYENMIDLYERLWPSPETHFLHEWDYIAEWQFFEYGPYELPDDSWKVLGTLMWRDALSTDPYICDHYGGRTHWVGMVHPDTNTHGTNGTGMLSGFDQAWVKFPAHFERPPWENAWDWPRPGQTLAHELGHNYDRHHVDCPPGVPDDVDNGYPYSPTCALDDRDLDDPAAHFGYDVNTLQAIAPDTTADLMSYADLRWDSDYTWEAIVMGMLLGAAADQRSPAGAEDLRDAASVILVGGAFTPSLGQGQLDYAWAVPTATLGSSVLSKWQEMAAPAVSPVRLPAATLYHLRLLDGGGGILDDRLITPTSSLDTPQPRQALFMLTFPAPGADVAQIDLLIDDTVVDSLHPGANGPTVQLLQPVGGEIIDQQLQIAWVASDPDSADQLRYNVQYSPDQGQNWRALAADLSHPAGVGTMQLTIEGDGIAGDTTTALVRVTASDGYHTASATSGPFTVNNRPPVPYIAAPLPGQQIEAGWPVSLRGRADDAEEGSLSGTSLSWTIDGDPVGTGAELSVRGLAPGSHDLLLTAQDSAGATSAAQAALEVAPLYIPATGGEPALDGFCDDVAYAESVALQLSPDDNGFQTTVRLARTDTDLWACFSGLPQGTGPFDPFAGLRVDADYSRDPWAQQDDYGFFVQEDGTPFTRSGDGSGGFALAGPGGLQARIDVQDSTWSAELRIEAAVLGGWEHPIGLKLGHYAVDFQGHAYHWPYSAAWNRPDTWAATALGELPRIHELVPDQALAGSDDLPLFVRGEHFVDGAEILWNGEPLPTGFWTDQYLGTIISATRLTAASVVTVTVRNPGLEEIPSNPSFFTIASPVPTITALMPVTVTAGSGAFSLTVNGVGFLPGAAVYWNGEPRPTTFVSSVQLLAQISASNVVRAGTVAVVVRNPPPTASTSQAATFVIEDRELVLPFHIYLPITQKAVSP